MTPIEEYYSHRSICGAGEVTSAEAVEYQLDLTKEACENIMRVAERIRGPRPKWWPRWPRRRCSPEMVVIVALLRGLTGQLEVGNKNLLIMLARLFGERRVQAAPPGAQLVH